MGSEKNGDFQKALKELQGLGSQWDWKAGNEFSQNFCKSQTNFLNDFFFSCLGNCFNHKKSLDLKLLF